jgi:ankyrin repeat protein
MKSFLLIFFVSLFLFLPSLAQKKNNSNDKIADKFTDAAQKGNLEQIKSMLANGVNIDIEPSRHKGWTALMSASTFGKTEVVKYLIFKGANVKVKLEKGETTLIQAAQNDKPTETVKALIKAGVEINAQTNEGLTALMRFAWAKQSESVKLLLEAGADTKLRNKIGWTAFYFACSHGNDEQIVKYLIDAGANPNERDETGKTPLMWLGWGERTENFKALIVAGADVKAKDNDGKTALMISASRFFYEEVKILLDAEADVTAKDKNGWNALMYTSASGFRKSEIGAHGDGMIVWLKATKIIEELISLGNNLNDQNNDGDTALILAVKVGNAHFAETLLARGAHPNIKNKNGKTANDFMDADYKKKRDAILSWWNRIK